jgi:predicted alpha/beta-fold hydrolase
VIVKSRFRPAWWLPGGHLQTLWAGQFRRAPHTELRRERLELDDGDFIDLDWLDGREDTPVILILHGLEGSSKSRYAAGLLRAFRQQGWRALVMHFRGCSGEPNRLQQRYNACETADVERVYCVLKDRFPDDPLGVVGISLGGSVLIKWLSEHPEGLPLCPAIAVSTPYELARCAERLRHGISRLYQRSMIKRMISTVASKHRHMPANFDLEKLKQQTDLFGFDNTYTAPVHGFGNVDNYYRYCSARQYLKDITTPLLLIHARNDPFMYPDAIPKETELSAAVTLELSGSGGHVGFVESAGLFRPVYWLEKRIVSAIRESCL